jgi:hypothetical protein
MPRATYKGGYRSEGSEERVFIDSDRLGMKRAANVRGELCQVRMNGGRCNQMVIPTEVGNPDISVPRAVRKDVVESWLYNSGKSGVRRQGGSKTLEHE